MSKSVSAPHYPQHPKTLVAPRQRHPNQHHQNGATGNQNMMRPPAPQPSAPMQVPMAPNYGYGAYPQVPGYQVYPPAMAMQYQNTQMPQFWPPNTQMGTSPAGAQTNMASMHVQPQIHHAAPQPPAPAITHAFNPYATQYNPPVQQVAPTMVSQPQTYTTPNVNPIQQNANSRPASAGPPMPYSFQQPQSVQPVPKEVAKKREWHGLQIIDPDTNEEVDVNNPGPHTEKTDLKTEHSAVGPRDRKTSLNEFTPPFQPAIKEEDEASKALKSETEKEFRAKVQAAARSTTSPQPQPTSELPAAETKSSDTLQSNTTAQELKPAQPEAEPSVVKSSNTPVIEDIVKVESVEEIPPQIEEPRKVAVAGKPVEMATVNEKPVAVTEKPVAVPEKPVESAAVTEKPAAVTEKPAAVTEKPDAVTEKPDAVTEQPDAVTEKPAAVTEKPAAVTEKPAAVTEKPAAVTEKPAAVTEKPAAVTEKPAAVTEKLVAVTEKPAAVTQKPVSVTEKPVVAVKPVEPVAVARKPVEPITVTVKPVKRVAVTVKPLGTAGVEKRVETVTGEAEPVKTTSIEKPTEQEPVREKPAVVKEEPVVPVQKQSTPTPELEKPVMSIKVEPTSAPVKAEPVVVVKTEFVAPERPPVVIEEMKKVEEPVVEQPPEVKKEKISDEVLMPPPAVPSPTNNNIKPPPLHMSVSMSAMPDSAKLTGPAKDEDPMKKYDREFLLSLQFHDLSQKKPDDLMASADFTSIALKEPITYRREMKTNRKGIPDFTPDYFNRNTSNSGKSRNSAHKQQPDRQIRQSQSAQPKQIDFKREIVVLNKAENAWSAKAALNALSDEEKENETLIKNFRAVLNKITPQTFEKLQQKICALPVKTAKNLNSMMELVFEKAIAEPSFAKLYAKLCQKLSEVFKEFEVEVEPGIKEQQSFRKILLMRCQREFESNRREDEELSRKLEVLKAAKTDVERKTLKVEYDAFELRTRKRKLGAIQFIGEIFKLRMLAPKIMHSCIEELLKDKNDESLECLCKLLTTMGKDLDDYNEKSKRYNDQYFSEIRKITENRKTSSRIRFALQDVLDLRASNWIPRRDTGNPKTLQEIQAQATVEAHERQALADQMVKRSSNHMDRRPPQAQRPRREDGEWSTIGASKVSSKFDSDKMRNLSKISTQSQGSDQLVLGPVKQSWGKGSGSGSAGRNTPTNEMTQERSATPNRFAMFSDDQGPVLTSRGSGGRGLVNERRNMGGRGRGNDRRNITPRSSMERNNDRSNPMTRSMNMRSGTGSSNSSRGPSRDSSMERSFSRERRSPLLPRPDMPASVRIAPLIVRPEAVRQLSPDEWNIKMKGTIDEYVHSNDLREAVECIKEILPQINLDLLTESAINYVLEKSETARKRAGHLMSELVHQKLLPLEKHLKGMAGILEMTEDLAIDIPNIWMYLAQILAPPFTDSRITLSQLKDFCKPLKPMQTGHFLVAAILNEAAHGLGHIDLAKKWSESGLDWKKDFLPGDLDPSTFLQQQKLEWISKQTPGKTQKLTLEQVCESLDKALHQSKPNENIFDLIDSQLDDKQKSSLEFTKHLSKVVLTHCLKKGKQEFDEKCFKDRVALLRRSIDIDTQKQMSALIAAEDLVTQLGHPNRLLIDIFFGFTNEDLVADEVFWQWEASCKNGVAVQSSKKFFEWLHEEDLEEEK